MRISPTLSRYIARQFLLAFLAVLAAILGLILVFDVIELIRRAAGRPELGFGMIVMMALFKLPQMMHTIMPFAVMIGAMIAFWRLTRTHELVTVRAAGISAWQFLAPVLGAVFAIGLFEMMALNPLAAVLYGRFERMQDEVLLNRGSSIDVSEVGLWLREGADGGQVVVHADEVRQEGLSLHLKDVHIFIYDRPDHFSRRINANSAQLADGAFEMEKAWIMEAGKASEFRDAMTIPTALTLERVHDNFASPETVPFWQLPSFIAFFEKAGFTANKHRLHLQSLLAAPFLLSGMVLIAAIFTLKSNMRSGGLMLRVGAGVALGFLMYFFSKLVYALGLSATLPQALAAWSPALLAGLIGMGGLFYLEDG